jgi:thymidylate synthase
VTPIEALREVERDLWEMGIDVHPQTMQDKKIAGDDDYMTKEVQSYGFMVTGPASARHERLDDVKDMVDYMYNGNGADSVMEYILLEFKDRIGGKPLNPGNSYKARRDVWNEFLHGGQFHYTYSERMSFQVQKVLDELRVRPESRQGVINIHSNICPSIRYGNTHIGKSLDFSNMGGTGRIPCSMYYQVMIRNNHVDLIYTMRSCDFLTHFPVDFSLALMLQEWYADCLGYDIGTFTYFTGSLHAYHKDMKVRGIF